MTNERAQALAAVTMCMAKGFHCYLSCYSSRTEVTIHTDNVLELQEVVKTLRPLAPTNGYNVERQCTVTFDNTPRKFYIMRLSY